MNGRTPPASVLRRLRLAMYGFLVALGMSSASAQLYIVPDDDPDLARGWAAYQARDAQGAFAYFRKAAERDQRVAQFNLAVMLVQGEGVAADPAQGISWLRRSADNGLARAQYALGVFLERGQYVERSLTEATAWYEKAARLGWRYAQVSVATQYFLGRGAALDYTAAA